MALSNSYTFIGNGNWSLDGTSGSRTNGGDILVDVPEGSEVEVAFLYSTTYTQTANPGATLSLGDDSLDLVQADFTPLGVTTGFSLSAYRTDVTAFVSDAIGDGGNDLFTFEVSDLLGSSIDGYALAVVYSNPNEVERTIAFLDGFTNQAGDDFRLAFDAPLVVDPSLEIQMSLGIGFGFQGNQFSLIDVNGDRLTSAAGGYDDGSNGNGGLITIGGLGDDPANPVDPGAGPNGDQGFDDELYTLTDGGFLQTGDRSIFVQTLNPSNDDNIFFAGFNITAEATIATEGNDAPVARDDFGIGFETDRDSTFVTNSVFLNDFDPDGDPIDILTVEGNPAVVGDVFNLPSGARITLRNNGTFEYDPNGAFDALPDGQDAVDTFTYTLTDGVASSTMADVDILVQDDTPAPINISLLGGGRVVEGSGGGVTPMIFTVQRGGNLDTAVDFTLEITPGLFSPAGPADIAGGLPQIVMGTINPGDTFEDVTINIVADNIPEFNETFRVEIIDLSTPDPTIPINVLNIVQDGIILDDDVPLPPPPPPVEADIFGDPHLTTLDGLGYDFQAVGEFTLLESTAGDPINVQVRTTPISDVVSVNAVMATELDGVRVVIDVNRDVPLTIDGVATTINPLTGGVNVGDGQVFFSANANEYTIVYGSGEQVKVGVFDGFINVCAFLNDTRAPGTVHGLLGNADGATGNDLALRDGTVLPQPIEFDTLYGAYADSWRITEDISLFDRASGETTDDFQDPSYPKAVVTLDDLPAQLVADAAAIVDAAGVTDPILRDAAILDVALSGNTDFAQSATALAADPTTETDPANAPALGATIGIRAAAPELSEGDSGEQTALFEIYRIGDTTAALDVDVTVSGDLDGNDTPDALTPQTISFAADETSKNVSFRINGDEDYEEDEVLTLGIGVDASIRDSISIISSDASVTVLNDDDAPLDAKILIGDGSNNTLEGGALDDTLVGLEGNDTLNGGAGVDTLLGGLGDDDLDGGPGGDLMNGGPGSDSYWLDNPFDVVFESGGWSGIDRIFSTVSFDSTNVAVERFKLLGSDNVDIIGNALDNLIIGNEGNNRLEGLGGDDDIRAAGGDDILVGGLGADLMNGGQGSDMFYVDDIGDRVVESAKWQGTDHVMSSVDFLMGRSHIENLTLTGTDDIRGIGNGLMNTITGNAGDNILDGGKNVDTLIGGDGNDTYLLRAPGDSAVEEAGGGMDSVRAFRSIALDAHVENLYIQTLRNAAGDGIDGTNGIGNGLNNTIVGNPFNNTISGREGNDTLKGQGGADTFVFDRAFAPNNVDRIIDFGDGADDIMLKASVFTGLSAGALAADAFVLGTAAADANDRIIYDQTTGQLWHDADGVGGADASLFATLSNKATLDADDFSIF